MTTIAYDGKSVAVDSQCTNGATVSRMNKALRLKGGGLLISAGKTNDAYRVKRWLDEGSKGDPPAVDDGFGAFLIRGGRIRLFAGGSEPQPLPDKFFAIGSGRDFAIAAMHLGLSAEEGVKIACKYDAYTGGPIRVFQVR